MIMISTYKWTCSISHTLYIHKKKLGQSAFRCFQSIFFCLPLNVARIHSYLLSTLNSILSKLALVLYLMCHILQQHTIKWTLLFMSFNVETNNIVCFLNVSLMLFVFKWDFSSKESSITIQKRNVNPCIYVYRHIVLPSLLAQGLRRIFYVLFMLTNFIAFSAVQHKLQNIQKRLSEQFILGISRISVFYFHT